MVKKCHAFLDQLEISQNDLVVTMKLDPEIYAMLGRIEWFKQCGVVPHDHFDFETESIQSLSVALNGIKSVQWQDVRTEAQGDLTGCLAKKCNNLYGGYWNRLAKESRQRIETEIMPSISEALLQLDSAEIMGSILLDLNRIALYWSYQKQCRGVPCFFKNLLKVYEVGRLPCGWCGNLDDWPIGRLIVY